PLTCLFFFLSISVSLPPILLSVSLFSLHPPSLQNNPLPPIHTHTHTHPHTHTHTHMYTHKHTHTAVIYDPWWLREPIWLVPRGNEQTDRLMLECGHSPV